MLKVYGATLVKPFFAISTGNLIDEAVICLTCYDLPFKQAESLFLTVLLTFQLHC